MCCLRYEHEFYVQSRKRFPKEGRIVKTKRGDEKVIANDIFRERITLRGEDGEMRLLTLAELHEEANDAGAPLPVAPVTAFAPVATSDSESDDMPIEDVPESEMSDVAVDEETVESQAEAEGVEGEGGEAGGESRERRPHRRRGRRGGRRNRSGNRGARGDDGAASPDAESGESSDNGNNGGAS
jgi:hypothetical protein